MSIGVFRPSLRVLSTQTPSAVEIHRRHCRNRVDLDGLCVPCSAVVDLLACLTSLVGPWEVRNGNEEERVARVCDTGEGIVPAIQVSADIRVKA